jgi:predicted 3-demethylubiquinone-9 3-methyltransferase (glyoxalase superfamily)
MQKITTFLTFNDQAEEAVKLYTSIFKDSKITSSMPGPNGTVISLAFQLEGQNFIALNGGPSFSFAQGISLFVSCETQPEIDEVWEKLFEGGQEQPCGWLKDRFGVSWQVVPPILGKMLGDKDRACAKRVLDAMLKMTKIDIATLKHAYEG